MSKPKPKHQPVRRNWTRRLGDNAATIFVCVVLLALLAWYVFYSDDAEAPSPADPPSMEEPR